MVVPVESPETGSSVLKVLFKHLTTPLLPPFSLDMMMAMVVVVVVTTMVSMLMRPRGLS